MMMIVLQGHKSQLRRRHAVICSTRQRRRLLNAETSVTQADNTDEQHYRPAP